MFICVFLSIEDRFNRRTKKFLPMISFQSSLFSTDSWKDCFSQKAAGQDKEPHAILISSFKFEKNGFCSELSPQLLSHVQFNMHEENGAWLDCFVAWPMCRLHSVYPSTSEEEKQLMHQLFVKFSNTTRLHNVHFCRRQIALLAR